MDMKALLQEAWKNVFHVEEAGDDADFFEAGGDSIMAVQLSAWLLQKGVKLDLADIFTTPKLGELAKTLKETTPMYVPDALLTKELAAKEMEGTPLAKIAAMQAGQQASQGANNAAPQAGMGDQQVCTPQAGMGDQQVCTPQAGMGDQQVCTPQAGMGNQQVCTPQAGMGNQQVCTPQAGMGDQQVCTPQAGMGDQQVCTPGMGNQQVCTPGMGNQQVCTPGMGNQQVCTPGMGNQQVCTPGMGSQQVCTPGMGSQQVCTPGMGSQQVCTPGMGNQQVCTPQAGMGDQQVCTPQATPQSSQQFGVGMPPQLEKYVSKPTDKPIDKPNVMKLEKAKVGVPTVSAEEALKIVIDGLLPKWNKKDDLFAQGLTSLDVVKVVTRCGENGYKVDMKDVYMHSTFNELVKCMKPGK